MVNVAETNLPNVMNLNQNVNSVLVILILMNVFSAIDPTETPVMMEMFVPLVILAKMVSVFLLAIMLINARIALVRKPSVKSEQPVNHVVDTAIQPTERLVMMEMHALLMTSVVMVSVWAHL